MIQAEKLDQITGCLDESIRLIFINGHLSLEQSCLDDLPEDLILTDIKTACRNYPSLFARLEFKLTEISGLFCYVPKNLKIPKPLKLLFSGSQGAQLNHLIYLEEGAELSFFEEYRAETAEHQIKHRIFLEANAEFNYYKLQEEASVVVHSDNFLIEQSRDSRFRSTMVCLGAKSAEDVLKIRVLEPNARCELKAISYAKVSQSIKHHLDVEHLSESCFSEQVYKNMALDQARVAFKGRVVVHPNAQKTVAHQLNENLLLSEKAEIDAKPELEIYADDVKCSHGSTVGQLDQNALFYLRSRGLSLSQAKQLLGYAFAVSILDDLKHPGLADSLKAALLKSFGSCEG